MFEVRFICKLKQIMEDKGIEPVDIHRGTGLSPHTIRGLTNNATIDRIDRGTMNKLVNFLEVEPLELWSIEKHLVAD